MTNINSRKIGLLALISKNWQGYLWRISLSAAAILIIALTQQILVLKIPFQEISLRLLLIPLLVGITIGFFYTTIRLMQNQQKKQLIELAVKEDQLLREIKQREEHAKKEQRLSYAIKASQEGLWDWNIKTDKVYYSPRWQQILGYEENSVLFTLDTWRNALHPDDAQRVLDGLESHLYGQAPRFLEDFRLKNASGNWVWVQGRGQTVEYDDSGAPTRAVGTMSDISDRKRIENALQELLTGTAVTAGQDFFESLAHTLSDVLSTRFVLLAQLNKLNPDILNPLAAWDNDFTEKTGNCYVSGTPCAVTVRDGQCFIDSDLRKSFPDDQMLKLLDAESYMGVALKGHEGNVIGVLALVDSYKLPVWKKDLAGAILPVFAARASAEIERRNIDSELSCQKERAQVILHSIDDAVITTDAQGNIDYMNPVAENLTGWSLQDSIGIHLSELCGKTDTANKPSLSDVVEQYLHNGDSSLGSSNLHIRDRKGKLCDIEQSVSAIKNNQNQVSGVVVVFREVSDTGEMAVKCHDRQPVIYD
jgi:PAS domain S-box-containing protein